MRIVGRVVSMVCSLLLAGGLVVTGGPASAADPVERAQRRLNSLGCNAGPAQVSPRASAQWHLLRPLEHRLHHGEHRQRDRKRNKFPERCGSHASSSF